MGWIEIVSFIVGAISGALICYFVVARRRAESAVGRQMKDLQEEFTAYRENVNQHFHQTADLVNNLSENYISVQKHLESAASSFAEAPKSFSIDENTTNTLPTATATKAEFASLEIHTQTNTEEEDAEFSAEAAEPPRDYAPKDDSEEQGTLDEGFRLQEETANPTNTTPASTT